MPKTVVFNWKMNPGTLAEAKSLFAAVDQAAQRAQPTRVIVCPPFQYLLELSEHVAALRGAQDVFWESNGPYTGEVAPAMLKNAGIEYTIVGHSERRSWLNETDAMINKKVRAALEAGLTVILCVGEPNEVRSQGFTAAEQFVSAQLTRDLENIPRDAQSRLMIAYEPLWAIGSGTPDKPEESGAMAAAIAAFTATIFDAAVPVLYGGSVTSANIADFLARPEIGGVLVGGASLRLTEIEPIVTVAAHA